METLADVALTVVIVLTTMLVVIAAAVIFPSGWELSRVGLSIGLAGTALGICAGLLSSIWSC